MQYLILNFSLYSFLSFLLLGLGLSTSTYSDEPNADRPSSDKPNSHKLSPNNPNTNSQNSDNPNPNKPSTNKPSPKDTVFNIHSDRNSDDYRSQYEKSLITLALEKTRAKYGGYIIKEGTINNTHLRSLATMQQNRLPNYIRTFEYSPEHVNDKQLRYIDFPAYRGIMGYRICFVPENRKAEIAKNSTLEGLQKFEFGQGIGWLDSTILREHNYTVREVGSYTSLFKMTAFDRIQLFCRGVNEILPEHHTYKDLHNLSIDESFAFYYPFPLYFFSNIQNKAALDRIKEGLDIANNDGSFEELWLTFYATSIEFSNLKSRNIIRLENSTLKNLHNSYEDNFYDPIQSK
ncbi:MAG: hypothetical protein ACI93R_001266 [Flavobacteriales bacterium]|jgi:hypothetical protein